MGSVSGNVITKFICNVIHTREIKKGIAGQTIPFQLKLNVKGYLSNYNFFRMHRFIRVDAEDVNSCIQCIYMYRCIFSC